MKSNHELNDLASLITDYQAGNHGLLELLWEKISAYVRFYPTLAFRERDEDLLSEFYLYVMERREALFNKFNHRLSAFSTYLSIRLRTYYYNYHQSVQSSKARNPKINYYENENIFSESKEEALLLRDSFMEEPFNDKDDNLFFPNPSSYNTSSSQGEEEIIEQEAILKYLVMKLYYFDFFNEDDYILLQSYTGKNFMELLKEMDDLKDKIFQKSLALLKQEEKMNKIYFEILDLQQKSQSSPLSQSSQSSQSLAEKTELEQKLNQRRESLLKKYRSISVFPPFKNIATILNQSETKVANIIVYYRRSLEKTLSKNIRSIKNIKKD